MNMKSEVESKPFVHSPGAPMLPSGTEGVVIGVSGLPGKPPSLQGHCRLSNEAASSLSDTLLHNVAIVCTYGPALRSFSFPLIRGEIVFDEDILRENGVQQAFFNIDLKTAGLPSGQGRYFALASFHTFLSEVVAFHWDK
jgi:hypothetical protein